MTMAAGPNDYDTFFSPGGEPSGPTKGPDRSGTTPPDPSRSSTERNYGETEALGPTGPGVTSPATSASSQVFAPHPDVPANVAALGDKLVQLQIVTRDQWNEACHRAAGVEHFELIVKELRGMTSERKTRGEAPLPALTEFQAEAILQNQMRRLRLGPYLLIDRVGAGGMGEVFRGWNLNLDRIEAIKTITSDEVTGSTIGLARFDREARVLAQLDHPCITTIYSTGREDGVAYIAMEYVRGKTLVQRVKDSKAKGEQVPVAWAVDVMKEVASALEHAHTSGVIHRDIKPNNIMVTHDGEVRVLDMGIARLVSGGGSGQGMTGLTRHVAGMGTPEVMPPEQWADATTVSPASDIYSLGCTFFYLLAGRMPYEATDLHSMMTAHLTAPPPDIREFRPDAPRRLAEILQKMMAKDAADRFARCSELIEALETCRDGIDSTAEVQAEEEPAGRGLPWLWIAAASVLIAGLSLAGYAGYRWMQPDYAGQADKWLAQFQESNSDQWQTVRSLKGAVAKGPYATVDSSEKLKQFQEWVRDETARRRDVEFQSWLEAQQRDHADVWPDPQSLQAMVVKDRESASTAEDFAALKSRIEDQTRTRADLHSRAKEQVAKAKADKPDVWLSVDDVEAVAANAVPIHSMASVQDLDRRQKAIDAEVKTRLDLRQRALDQVKEAHLAAKDVWKSMEAVAAVADAALPLPSVRKEEDLVRRKDAMEAATRKRFREYVMTALGEYQAANSEVWKSLEILTAWANQKSAIDDIARTEDSRRLLELVEQETWQRRSLKWVLQYRAEHPTAWKSDQAIIAFVESNFPDGVESMSSMARMETAVRAETKNRMRTQIESWAEELVAAAPNAWPPPAWLTQSVVDREDLEVWSGSDRKQHFVALAKENAYKGVIEAPLTSSGDALFDFQRAHLVRVIGWLLGVQRAGIAPTGQVKLIVEVDGQEVTKIPVEKQAEYSIESSIPGYVTFLVFETPNRAILFQWNEPVRAGVRTKLVALTPSVATADRYLVYVTNENPWAKLPRPGAAVRIELTNFAGYLAGMVNPPITEAATKDGLEVIRKAMPAKDLLDGLLESLWEGKAPDYIPPQPVRLWTRVAQEIPAVPAP